MNNANTPAMPNHLQTLIEYQNWRRGEDERVFEDIGLTPASIGEALDWAISELDKPEWAQAGDNTLHHEMTPCQQAFEKWFSNDGEFLGSISKGPAGGYRLMVAASAWDTWQNAWSAMSDKVLPSYKALAADYQHATGSSELHPAHVEIIELLESVK